METLVSIEEGIFDVENISIYSYHKDSLQSTLLLSDFGNIINGANGPYRPNLNLYLHGNGRLSVGLNKLIVKLITTSNTFIDTFEVNLDENISKVDVTCLIGKSTESLSYVKDVTVKRIIFDPENIKLLPNKVELNEPLDVLIYNGTSQTLYGSLKGNHFVAELKMKKGLGYGMYDYFLPCVPSGEAIPLLEGDSTRCMINDERDCVNISIDKAGEFMVVLYLSHSPNSDEIPIVLVDKAISRFRVIDLYRTTYIFKLN